MLEKELVCIDKSIAGFVKIWKSNPATGESLLVVDKQNLIMRNGARLIARALGGDDTAKIWGMYIGYNNSADSFNAPAITVDYANPFSGFVVPFGYLREPLTFSPDYMSSAGYSENIVLFSTIVTSSTKAGGADFTESSKIYEVALVSAGDVNDPAKDTVFSRTNFNPVQYDSTYNFTITWGVRILLS
jgi:hypothetical protein